MAMKPQNLYITLYRKETRHKRTYNNNSVDMTSFAYNPKETNKPYTNSIMNLPTRTIK